MRSTDEAAEIASALPDLRNVPLTKIAAPSAAGTDQAVARVLRDMAVPAVRVARFNSAI
jgi:FXSXX-COOH protein